MLNNKLELEPKRIQAMISLLDDTDTEVSAQVYKELYAYGKEVVMYLERAWEQTMDINLQRVLEELIHAIQLDEVKASLLRWYESPTHDLLEGVLIVNRYQYPEIHSEELVQQLEDLRVEVWRNLSDTMTAVEKVKVMNYVLYTTNRFSGNMSNPHDPQNFYLSQVLSSKKGSPILLGIIYLYIAQKLDIPVYGVDLPHHFVLAYAEPEMEAEERPADIKFYINVFNRGYLFNRGDIDGFLKQLGLQPQESYYNPCSTLDIVRRVLRNLVVYYQSTGNEGKAGEVAGLLKSISPED